MRLDSGFVNQMTEGEHTVKFLYTDGAVETNFAIASGSTAPTARPHNVLLWIIIVVLIRDLLLLFGGAFILDKYNVRIDVIFPGKVVTTLMFIGFFGLMMNWPLVPGLGIVEYPWLPGFCDGQVSWGIWCVYLGLLMGVGTTAYYVTNAIRKTNEARERMKKA